jgi:catechol 2,3-dioxygenase-like lactoylglutathione lyase family enzyme
MDDGAMGYHREEAQARSRAGTGFYQGTSPIKVKKLGHFAYEVGDLDRSIRFWTEVMGFQEVERNEIGMVFLRYGADHHTIGLVPSTTKDRPAADAGLRFNHLAMEVENVDVLLKTRDYFIANGIPIVFEGRKGPGCNYGINFLDPDGFEFEIYCNMDQIDASGRRRPASQFRRAGTLAEAIANPVPERW